MKRNNKKGFTIVELVIVIAVIAILAGVLIPTFSGIISKAKESKALQEAQNAYKEAYALAIADGKIDTDDIYNVGNYTFTFTGSIDAIEVAVAAKADSAAATDGYKVTVENGVVKVDDAAEDETFVPADENSGNADENPDGDEGEVQG